MPDYNNILKMINVRHSGPVQHINDDEFSAAESFKWNVLLSGHSLRVLQWCQLKNPYWQVQMTGNVVMLQLMLIFFFQQTNGKSFQMSARQQIPWQISEMQRILCAVLSNFADEFLNNT